MKNPHFDDNRVIWKDQYSGLYSPVDYTTQFDAEWRLFLEKKIGFAEHSGVEIGDPWIDDRIYDLTGVEGVLCPNNSSGPDRGIGGRQQLDLTFSVDHFRGKRCLDAACGAGRWSRALMALGANVKSVDVSEHSLQSVRSFNTDVERVDLFDIPQLSHLCGAFDFTICWGALMHTHDPRLAFDNVAKTVGHDGELYIMVYAPTYHNNADVLAHRKHYHRNLKTFAEKLAYVYEMADRPENAINYLDMLNTFYNWVVPEETIHNWFRVNGFTEVVTLNAHEKLPVAFHVFGRRRKYKLPYFDDRGNRVPHPVSFDIVNSIPLAKPFQKEQGWAWMASLENFVSCADRPDANYRSRLVMLEDSKPLWLRHATHDDIRNCGKGLYSHWHKYLLFSTSDNSDPNSNGRTYEIVFADSAE